MTEQRSKVWKFFSIHDEDQTVAVCFLCNAKISRGGIGKKQSTSSLLKHLKHKHFKEYEDAAVTQQSQALQDCPRIVQQSMQSLQNWIVSQKRWPINDKMAMDLHFAIGEMIAVDNQPYSVVENIGFRRMLAKAQPKYDIPSRKYFTENIIPQIYNGCKIKICEMLDKCRYLSLTSDLWTSDVNNKSFISLTAHWLTENFESKHAVLNCKSFDGSHTGERIANVLQEMLLEFKLTEKVHLFLRDSGTNIKKAAKDMNLNHESCFIHTLQLVVLDSIKSQTDVLDLIHLCRNIVTHFNHSSPSREKLENIQKDLNMIPKKLVQDVLTRWNSSYYMMNRLLELKRPLTLFCSENDSVQSLSKNQWILLENILTLLKPFEEVTKHFSSSSAVISEVIPTLKVLKTHIQECTANEINKMKNSLIAGIEQRFSEVERKDNYKISTFVDPRFKNIFYTPNVRNMISQDILNFILRSEDEDIQDIQAQIEETVSTCSTVDENSKSVHETEGSDSDQDEIPLSLLLPSPQKKLKSNLNKSVWDSFSDMVAASSASTSGQTKNVSFEEKIKSEIQAYLNLNVIDRKASPLGWWQINREYFPNLALTARTFLSAPASTISSERLFSEAGNVFESTRNRLLPENGEQLIFLHDNLPLLNFEY